MIIKLLAHKMDRILLYKHATSFHGRCTSENFSCCLYFVASCQVTYNSKIPFYCILDVLIFVVNVALAQFAPEVSQLEIKP